MDIWAAIDRRLLRRQSRQSGGGLARVPPYAMAWRWLRSQVAARHGGPGCVRPGGSSSGEGRMVGELMGKAALVTAAMPDDVQDLAHTLLAKARADSARSHQGRHLGTDRPRPRPSCTNTAVGRCLSRPGGLTCRGDEATTPCPPTLPATRPARLRPSLRRPRKHTPPTPTWHASAQRDRRARRRPLAGHRR
jgi:hypothetical protein